MAESSNEIEDLFRQTQAGESVVAEFAGYWVEVFRRDTQVILDWHRREAKSFWRSTTTCGSSAG